MISAAVLFFTVSEYAAFFSDNSSFIRNISPSSGRTVPFRAISSDDIFSVITADLRANSAAAAVISDSSAAGISAAFASDISANPFSATAFFRSVSAAASAFSDARHSFSQCS